MGDNLGIWEELISLAVEGYNAGSLGISAAIADQEGNILAKGRNQLSDNLESCNQIKMTSVAHAEINALHNLVPERQRDQELVLYTTVEPCPMCLGAVAMSQIRKIVVGSADPYAGSIRLLKKDPYLTKKGISTVFEQGRIEEVCFALHYMSLKRYVRPGHVIFDQIKERYPAYTKKLDNLFESAELPLDKPLDGLHLMKVLEQD